jgi:phosphoglycolate phosphatase
VRRYDLAAFDFDGTLADTMPWVATIMHDVSDRYGIRRVEASEVELLRSMNALQIAKYLCVPPLKVPAMGAYVRRRMAREIDAIRLVPGITEALRALTGAGVTLAVVSSNAERNVRQVLGPRLAALMAMYECGVSLFGKPAKLRHVLHTTQTAPERAIYFGDEIRDIEAAQSAGMASGAVVWGYNSEASLRAHHPAVVAHTPEEIVEVVLGK